MDTEAVWAGLAAVPIVAGLVQVAKPIGLPHAWAPVLALILGISGSVGFSYTAGEATIQVAVVQGLAIGLSSSGLYAWIGTGNDAVKGGGGIDTLNGGAGNDNVIGGGGNDTLEGGAGDDKLIGGGGDDTLVFDANDTAKVNGGGGSDTLRFEGSGAILDLVGQAGTLYMNIEFVDLGGTGNNTLLLDRDAVIDLSRSTNTLRVLGDAGDAVETTAEEWTDNGAVSIDGLIFNEYLNGEAILQVQTGVDQSLIRLPGDDLLIGGADNDVLKGESGTTPFRVAMPTISSTVVSGMTQCPVVPVRII